MSHPLQETAQDHLQAAQHWIADLAAVAARAQDQCDSAIAATDPAEREMCVRALQATAIEATGSANAAESAAGAAFAAIRT